MDTETSCSSEMTEHQCKFLNDVSARLTSKIHDLVQNEIANNLQQLKDDVSEKLNELLMYTDESISQLCSYKLEECNRLHQIIDDIKENTQTIGKGNDKIMKEQKRFMEVCSQLTNNPNLMFCQ